MSQSAKDEKTFRSYSTQDATQYAQFRQRYSEALYQSILAYHCSPAAPDTKLDTVVDIGCGPGIATFKLAEYFNSVLGLDPSEAMIDAARTQLAEKNSKKASIRFEVSTAEDIDATLVPDGSVDVITAATCAHWFDMTRFWPTAARILKPGGTVALWCSKSSKAHHSVPNAAKINAALEDLENKELRPFFEPGNLLSRDLYASIGLPWTISPPETAFEQTTFVRKLFGRDDNDDPFFDGSGSGAAAAGRKFDLDTMERMVATVSPVTRWREAHPKVKPGSEDDIVRRMRRIIEANLQEMGVDVANARVQDGTLGVMLLVRKKA
ncbi:S-adenosyl-L-methionine-dependent methyltransferase [Coniella lustricola]|uniref:S-adenosyl-L-methionine-dependent methyltransferase n=1 Tax=Coniella lustricola TaxID=2025994 RepID=A0A2T2ZT87_9PEZI|nr:S-adenosyl-L-methionine-dependent methyltransferase [Coniella lustricola]